MLRKIVGWLLVSPIILVTLLGIGLQFYEEPVASCILVGILTAAVCGIGLLCKEGG